MNTNGDYNELQEDQQMDEELSILFHPKKQNDQEVIDIDTNRQTSFSPKFAGNTPLSRKELLSPVSSNHNHRYKDSN